MLFKPFSYQFDGISFMQERISSALFADPGLGKTAMALTFLMIQQRQTENFKALIIAPKRVCDLVWPEEIKKWDHSKHFSYFRLTSEKDLQSPKLQSDVLIINIENIFPYIACLSKICTHLIIDESTGFKNHNSKRFKTIKPLLKKFKSRVIMTGTPMPKSYIDLFAQFYIVDLGMSLTDSITIYRNTFFDAKIGGWNTTKYVTYEPRPGAVDLINEIVDNKAYRIDGANNPKIPKTIYNLIYIDLSPKLQAQYDLLEQELYYECEGRYFIADNTIIKRSRCIQFANGIMYDEDKRNIFIHDEKINVIKELAESVQGKPLLIAYWYHSDLDLLKQRFKRLKTIGANEKDTAKVTKDWNAGKIDLLAGHPASVGHGLNIQFSTNHIVQFSLHDRSDLLTQFSGRLARIGQQESSVFVHVPIVRNTIDEVLWDNMVNKSEAQTSFLQYLERKNAKN